LTKALHDQRPLPVILKPAVDELLSSWLFRHAAFYGLRPLSLLRHLLPESRIQKIEVVDTRLSKEALERLAGFLRSEPADIERMTFSGLSGEARRFVARSPVQLCILCHSQNRDPDTQNAKLRGAHCGWRITCPYCGGKLSPLPRVTHVPVDEGVSTIWHEAAEGERLLDRLLADNETADAAVAAFRMLLLRRGRPLAGGDPSNWRAVDAVVPGFEDLARSCGLSRAWASSLITPILLRPLFLAGFRRLLENPRPITEILRCVVLGNYRLCLERFASKASTLLGSPLF
jgi:hypothetical protein